MAFSMPGWQLPGIWVFECHSLLPSPTFRAEKLAQPRTAHDTRNMTSHIHTCKRYCLQHGQEQKDPLHASPGSSGCCRHPQGPGRALGTQSGNVWECVVVKILMEVNRGFRSVLKISVRATSSRSSFRSWWEV